MCKAIILEILDILKLYKQIGTKNDKNQEIELFLNNILNQLCSNFEKVYKLRSCVIAISKNI